MQIEFGVWKSKLADAEADTAISCWQFLRAYINILRLKRAVYYNYSGKKIEETPFSTNLKFPGYNVDDKL